MTTGFLIFVLRTADYETRYDASRLETYGNNLKVVVDHLYKHCPNVTLLCFQTMVDSETVAKIVDYFPDLKGLQIGGLSLTSTYVVEFSFNVQVLFSLLMCALYFHRSFSSRV